MSYGELLNQLSGAEMNSHNACLRLQFEVFGFWGRHAVPRLIAAKQTIKRHICTEAIVRKPTVRARHYRAIQKPSGKSGNDSDPAGDHRSFFFPIPSCSSVVPSSIATLLGGAQ
jgi:hypothetical protein